MDVDSPERPKPGSVCALTCCEFQHRHPLTGAEPDYHYRVGLRWEPRWRKDALRAALDKSEWWYSATEVATILGVTNGTIVKHIRNGELPAAQPWGRHRPYFIKGADLDAWLRGQSKFVGAVK